MKLNLLTLFFVALFNLSFSQHAVNDVYLDETNKIIDERTFELKALSSVYYSMDFIFENRKYHKLRFEYFLGKIPDTKKSQLFKLLYQRHKIDTTKLLLIHYTDTLKSIDQFPKKNMIVYNADSTSHEHLISHKQFVKNHKKCIKDHKRYKNLNVLHMYEHNNGHPDKFDEVVWYKDDLGIIKKLFNDGVFKYYYILIKPDGSFYLENTYYNRGLYKDLLKNKKWDKHLTEFQNKLESIQNSI